MELSKELQAIKPLTQKSPLASFEYVRGFGVFGLPFDSGHVLALRVFPENSFAPYMTVWHRTPEGVGLSLWMVPGWTRPVPAIMAQPPAMFNLPRLPCTGPDPWP